MEGNGIVALLRVEEGSVHRSGSDRIDTDAAARQLLRHAAGEVLDWRLASGVPDLCQFLDKLKNNGTSRATDDV